MKMRVPGKFEVEMADVIDISYDQEAPDPLLVASLLGVKEDGSQEIICVAYLSVLDLIKKTVWMWELYRTIESTLQAPTDTTP